MISRPLIIEGIDIDDQAELEHKQDILDRKDEFNDNLILCLRLLMTGNNNDKAQEEVKTTADRKLRTSLQEVKDNLTMLDGRPEHTLMVQQYAEELLSYKEDLRNLNKDLVMLHTALRKLHFDCSCTTKGLSNRHAEPRASLSSRITAKLLKLQVTTINGEILKWRTFWDMFEVRIHNQDNPEKLLYLSQWWTCNTGD